MTRMLNLMGKQYNRLYVIELAGINKSGKYLWRCECDCGTAVCADTRSITSGHTKSCGCLKSERLASLRFEMTKPTPGDRFGQLTVIDSVGRDSAGRLLVHVQCDCGKTNISRWGNVRSGTTKTCGHGKLDGLNKHIDAIRAGLVAPTATHPWRKAGGVAA